jgi:hypothetical protein
MAEGMEDGGFCGGGEGNIRERVKVFGREAESFPLMVLLTEGCSDF